MKIVKMVMQKVRARSATGFIANSSMGETFIFVVGSWYELRKTFIVCHNPIE